MYAEREEWDRVARTCDRVLCLSPSRAEDLRDRGMAYLQLGHVAGARADLSRYLALHPSAEDSERVRNALVEANVNVSRLS